MEIFIDKPSVTEPKKGGRPLLRLNVLMYDPDDADDALFIPGAFIVEGLIHMPMYRLGAINVPSQFLGAKKAEQLYDAVMKIAEDFPAFFPLQPKELVMRALQPPAQTLIQKFPGYVKVLG